MTDHEIRATALGYAVAVSNANVGRPGQVQTERGILNQAELFQVYIRLGMEGAEGMLEVHPRKRVA